MDALFTPAVSSSGLSPLLPGRFTLARAPISNDEQPHVSHSRSGDLRTWQKRKSNPWYSHFPTDVLRVYKCGEKCNYIGCTSTCKTDDCQLLYTNRDVIFIKITSDVTNGILKMLLRKYLIPPTQQTTDIISQYWQSCSVEWLQASAWL